LAQQNSFGPAFLHKMLLRLAKGTSKPNTYLLFIG
jgi:hypothetical protein